MALTTAQLALALRIVGDVADTVPAGAAAVITRQSAVARALVTAHAPTAPEDVADEAVIRLVGFLYDQSPAMPRANNAMIASGAASILGPWHVARLVIPAGDQGDGAAIVALDGPAIVAALSALAGNARLPASAVRDLPQGGAGGGLTPDQLAVLRSAVIIGATTPSLSGRNLEFDSDGGDSKSLNLEGITHPVPEAADVGRVLEAIAAGVTDWRAPAAADPKRLVPAVGAGDVGRILTAPQAAGGQPTWNSNPGQTLAQVNARVRALVADWAETGNDARLPEGKLPAKLDDLADALMGTQGWQDSTSLDYAVASRLSSVAAPENPETSFGAFVLSHLQTPRQENVFVVVRIRSSRYSTEARDELRLAAGLTTVLGTSWTFLETVSGYHYFTVPVADIPAGDTFRVQLFDRFQFDRSKVSIPNPYTWALRGNTDVIPAAKLPSTGDAGAFVTELLDSTRGLTVVAANRSVQQSLTAFTTPLTLQASDHGVLFVSLQAKTSNTSRLGVIVNNNVTLTVSSNQFLSVLRSSDAYDGSSGASGNGLKVASFSVFLTGAHVSIHGAMAGTIDCYIAHNTANQVGTYAVYTPASGAGAGYSGTVAIRWEVTLLRTDASALTGPRIVTLLSALSGAARLPASAVRDLPAALTGPGIVTLLSALSGAARLPASAVRDLPSGGGGLTITEVASWTYTHGTTVIPAVVVAPNGVHVRNITTTIDAPTQAGLYAAAIDVSSWYEGPPCMFMGPLHSNNPFQRIDLMLYVDASNTLVRLYVYPSGGKLVLNFNAPTAAAASAPFSGNVRFKIWRIT